VQDWRGVWLLMAGAFSPLPLRSWLQRKPDWLDHQTVAALIFALKTFAAAILALFIAFWAGLDEPRWAFLTVFVVAQPNGGLVLAKSFYRILGSSAEGSGLGLAIVREIAQQHGADIDIFNNPRSTQKKFPGSLFRLTFPPSELLVPDADRDRLFL